MLCLQVIMPQLFYDVISAMSPWGLEDALFQVLQWQNMHVPDLLLKNCNSSEDFGQVNWLTVISKFYPVNSLYYPCICNAQPSESKPF